jgi:hypothetical protein
MIVRENSGLFRGGAAYLTLVQPVFMSAKNCMWCTSHILFIFFCLDPIDVFVFGNGCSEMTLRGARLFVRQDEVHGEGSNNKEGNGGGNHHGPLRVREGGRIYQRKRLFQ